MLDLGAIYRGIIPRRKTNGGKVSEHKVRERNLVAGVEPEAKWIRDLNAADILVQINSHEGAVRACEGLKTHCAYCGAEFPMWPARELMGHHQSDHAADLTMQQLAACAPLCVDEWTVHHVRYFMSFVLTYVPLRRRLRDLDLVKFEDLEQGSSSLLDGLGRRIQ